MKLHEYQSKQLFAKYGIPIPKGEIATTPEDARRIARDLGRRVVIKSQVLVGGRGKAGGVKLANTPDEAEIVAGQILGMNIKGLTVRKVLVDEAADIAQEIYLGIVLDRLQRRAVMMASAAGGMDIEEVARTTPEKIIRVAIDPFLGLREYQTRQIAYGIGLQARTDQGLQHHRARAVSLLCRSGCQPRRDQSAGRHGRGHAASGGRQDSDRRQCAVPPSRSGGAARCG